MIYQNQNFALDTQSYSLERNGEKHAVEPQVFDLLVYLIEHRNRVVTRDELLDNLWNGRIVSDSAINARLKEARKAIGDDGKKQNVIKTVHRRGYQFIADISTSPEIAHELTARIPPDPSFSEKPSVAVLPFENLGQESDSDYFADGLTRDINTNLCRYHELMVIDWHSAFEYRDAHASTENFARQIGVQYLASGSIRRADNRIRISAQLIEAATGKMIWADNLERAYDDILLLEDEIATRIAVNLVSHIEDESIARVARKPSDSMSAFDCVLQARQYQLSYDQDEISAARILLERAIELDPLYAAAYACHAHTHTRESETEWCVSRFETLKQAVELSRKAVALDEFDSFAHMALGWAYMNQEKFELAEVHIDRAIDCNPNDYDAYCIKCWLLAFTGDAAEATVCGARALQLNPLAPDECLKAITIARYTNGEYASAFEMLERIEDPDDQSEALRAACLAQLGRDSEARRAAARAVEMGGKYIQRQDWLNLWTFKYSRDREHFVDGLYKSGVLKDTTRVSAKPSIAVLQFTNLSDDPQQQYFSEGMATNICTRLSRIRDLKVISCIKLDLSDKSLTQIAKELEVSYLLVGSVQREDDQVRVFVELTDGASGEIKWADRFDRRGTKVIDIQDDIARAITGTLWSSKGRIREAEHEKLSTKPTLDFNAFDFILQGIFYKEKFSAEYNLKAHECFDKAIDLDPDSAEALGWSAWIHVMDIVMGWGGDSAGSLALAYSDARKAIALDPYTEIGHWALAATLGEDGDFDRAFAEYDKVMEINPNNADLLSTKGSLLAISGRFEEGIELALQAIQFNKYHPEWYLWDLGIAYFAANRLEQAIEAFSRMNRQNKDIRIYLAACYAQTGDLPEAQNQVSELFRIDSETSLEEIAESHSNLSDESLGLLMDGLRLAMDTKEPVGNLHIV
jgi:TolB-like protein/Flp pilus assembly protein TadD